MWFDELPVLWDLDVGKFDPMQTIQKALAMAYRLRIRGIGVESVAYQQTLCFWFEHVMQRDGVEGPEICEVHPGGVTKNSAIIQMFKLLVSKRIGLHSRVRNLVVNQITMFNPDKTNNKDDILDILRYIAKMEEKHSDSIQRDLLLLEAELNDGDSPDLLDTPF